MHIACIKLLKGVTSGREQFAFCAIYASQDAHIYQHYSQVFAQKVIKMTNHFQQLYLQELLLRRHLSEE